MEPHLARTVTGLIEALASLSEPSYLYFWGHTAKCADEYDQSCLSQWFPAEFAVDGQKYNSAEQFMMAAKATLFQDKERLREILATNNPGKAKSLGRKVTGFDQSIWNHHRFGIAVAGNLAKFKSDPAMLQYLANTGRRILVEASPHDRIWGIGLAKEQAQNVHPGQWKGENLLGFALMEVREQLASTHE